MALINCPKCSAELPDNANCCPKCGAPIVVHKWRCSKCGSIISEEPCPYCNSNQTAITTNSVGCESNVDTNMFFKKRRIGALITILVVAAVAIIFATLTLQNSANDNSGNDKLNGEYTAETLFGLNTIVFTNNGNFERYSCTYASGWQTIGGGTYSLSGNSLILYCSDGRVWDFYYDQQNDTMTQNNPDGTNSIYVRTN